MASARIDAGQGDLAMPMLEYAMNQAEPDAVRIVARERLARVKLDLGDAQGAMELLDAAPDQTGFEARFAEIRGDILRQQGDAASAVEQYRLALSLIEEGVGDRNFLQLKIDSLEGLIARDTDA